MTLPAYFIVDTNDGHISDFADNAEDAVNKSWWRENIKVIPVAEVRVQGYSTPDGPYDKLAHAKFSELVIKHAVAGVAVTGLPYTVTFADFLHGTIEPLLDEGKVIKAIKDLRGEYPGTSLGASKYFIDWYRTIYPHTGIV